LTRRDFDQSIENFDKALQQLDGNLPEALFNRALCYEKQFRLTEAKSEWNEYLKYDSSSPWAVEARQHLSTSSANP